MKHALLRTLAGRAIVIGLAVKLLAFLWRFWLGAEPAFVEVAETVAGLAAALGAVYFLFRLALAARRGLLWRVRRKLILSYVFIGFVPATLLVAFFVLCGLLLFFNFSSYLVQSEFRALADQIRFLAAGAALEIQRSGGRDVEDVLKRKLAGAEGASPGLSIAVVPVDRPCDSAAGGPPAVSEASPRMTAGAWAHDTPPANLPAWIGCDGFSGAVPLASSGNRQIVVRAAAFPD